jgi:hypothetical protein
MDRELSAGAPFAFALAALLLVESYIGMRAWAQLTTRPS